jgi:hypothetical protein
VKFARAQLDLKERQYGEYADALRDLDPKHPGIAQARAAAEELKAVRKQLDQQRAEFEDRKKKERKGANYFFKKYFFNEKCIITVTVTQYEL